MLEVSGLPPTPDDKEYEVWWIGAKQGPLRAGLFEPLSSGATIVSLDLPPPGEVVLASAITLEPRGGVEKPSGAMYLKGDFPRR
jgi:anti-sigma-K factor RskA